MSSLNDLQVRIDAWLHKMQLKFLWNPKNRQKFYKMLATFARDGIPVREALQEIDARLQTKKDPRGLITRDLLQGMRGADGQFHRLGKGLKAWSPSLEAISIDAGESSGHLETGLRMAARLSGVNQQIRSSIRKELMSPAVLIIGFIGMLMVIKYMVIPGFEEALPRAVWPASTSALADLADIAGIISVSLVSLILSVFAVFRLTKDRWIGVVRDRVDQVVFPWTLHRRVSAAILLNCFAALTRAGIPMDEIFRRLRSNATPWEGGHIHVMAMRKRHGMPDGEAMTTPLFDDESHWMISVYAKRTTFSESLDDLSNEVIESTLQRIVISCGVINLIAMALTAGQVIWVVFSLIDFSLAAKSMAGS